MTTHDTPPNTLMALVAIRDACERIARPNGCNDDFSLGWRKAHEKLGAFASSAISLLPEKESPIPEGDSQ